MPVLHRVPVALLVAGSCRAPTAPPAEPPPVVTVRAPEPARARRPEPAPADAPTVTLAPTAMDATIPETSFPADAFVVASPHDSAPVTLFADERAQLREAVAAAMRKRGRPVVPVAELERIETSAARGVLALEGGQACRAALTEAEVEHRYFRKHAIVRPSADCTEKCRLTVDLDPPEGSREAAAMLESKDVRRPEDPRAWVAAAGKLREVEEGYGMLTGWGTGGGAEVMFLHPESIGPWKGDLGTPPFDAVEHELSACADPNPLPMAFHSVRAAVDPGGAVSRCETELDRPSALGGPDIAACICGVVGKIQLPRGAAGRRFRVSVLDRGTGGVSGIGAKLSPLQTGTDDWITRLQASHAVERCLDAARPSQALSATIALPLAADGSIGDIAIVGPIRTDDTMKFADCLARELATIALPCRPPGLEELRVRLDVVKAP
jgi:hypothetical protein